MLAEIRYGMSGGKDLQAGEILIQGALPHPRTHAHSRQSQIVEVRLRIAEAPAASVNGTQGSAVTDSKDTGKDRGRKAEVVGRRSPTISLAGTLVR